MLIMFKLVLCKPGPASRDQGEGNGSEARPKKLEMFKFIFDNMSKQFLAPLSAECVMF